MAFFEAVIGGDLKKARKLLGEGVDVNESIDDGFTALHYAVKRNDLRMVKLLCDHQADVNKLTSIGLQKSPLYIAAERNLQEIVKYLVKKRADVDKPATSDSWVKEKGQTPVHRAAYKGNLDIVKILVTEGANVNAVDEDGWTPLHCASYLGRQEIVDYLLGKGAEINKRDRDGFTPLDCATDRGYLETVTHLLAKGADIDESDREGMTVLHHACKHGYLDLVKRLLDERANTNRTDKKGDTPLHYAAKSGNDEIVTSLVRRGADVKRENHNGESPLHRATSRGHLDIAKILVSEGASISKGDKNGWTPLHTAASLGHLEIINFFLRQGVEVELQNDEGETPLDLACDDDIRDTINRYVKNGFVSEIDNRPADNISSAIDESGGRPSEEELCNVAKSIANLAEFWCFFSDLGMEGEKIATFLPINDFQTPAGYLLEKWGGNTQTTETEKRTFLRRVAEYHRITSPEGKPLSKLLDEISTKIHTVERLVALSSTLGVELGEALYEIDKTAAVRPLADLEENSLLLLREWVYSSGGSRAELLRALQAGHINDAAETISSAIKSEPALEDSFSYTTVDHQGGEVQLEGGDVKLDIPSGALSEEASEVVTIKIPSHVRDIPDEEGDIQASPPVQCSPSGLKFEKPVKITLPHCTRLAEITKDTQVILCVNEGSGEFTRQELKGHEYAIKENAVEISVNHFSTFRVMFRKLLGLKIGCIPVHPETMPKSRKPILQVYIYHMYKRNEQKILSRLKQLSQKFSQAADPLEIYPKSEGGDLTIVCTDEDTNEKQEFKVQYNKLLKKKSTKITFELDFSKQRHEREKNFRLSLVQETETLETQLVSAVFKEPERSKVSGFDVVSDIIDHVEPHPENELEEMFFNIAEDIETKFVHSLGLELDFRHAQITKFEQSNYITGNVNSYGTYYMLVEWAKKNKLPSHKINKNLRIALINVELVELAEDFFPNTHDSLDDEEEVTEIVNYDDEVFELKDTSRILDRSVSQMTNPPTTRWWLCCCAGAFQDDYSARMLAKRARIRTQRFSKVEED